MRVHADGTRTVCTRNLGALRSRLGDGVLNAFTRAFLLVDRLDSLVAFEHLSLKHLNGHRRQQHRNHFAFLVFLMGTMVELSRVLSQLRAALAKHRLLDIAEWQLHLGTWDSRWRNDAVASAFRSTVAFHVDAPFLEKGLDSLPQTGRVEIFVSDNPSRRQDGAFILGPEAVINGLGLTPQELEAFFSRPIPDLAVYDGLSTVFLGVLDRAHLKPLIDPKA
jgi:hypothetical protein